MVVITASITYTEQHILEVINAKQSLFMGSDIFKGKAVKGSGRERHTENKSPREWKALWESPG